MFKSQNNPYAHPYPTHLSYVYTYIYYSESNLFFSIAKTNNLAASLLRSGPMLLVKIAIDKLISVKLELVLIKCSKPFKVSLPIILYLGSNTIFIL